MLPAELQTALSQQLGVPVSSVTVFARQMREAGHLSKSGRGMYAARMTARDCAALLCAVVGAAGPAEAAAQVEAFQSARAAARPVPGVLADMGLDGEGFGAVDALATMIESFRTGEADLCLGRARLTVQQAREAFTLSFRLTAPVRLTVQLKGPAGIEGREFEAPGAMAAMPGMRTFRVVSGDPLVSLGLALRA